MTESTKRIIAEILKIPKGKVSCYRDIAQKAGLPNGARQVVRVLHSMSEKYKLPWHRVIRADGFIALPQGEGRDLQVLLLRKEKVPVAEEGRVDLNKFGWRERPYSSSS